ncbi:MAG: hypothetical protein IJM32_08325 [Ruminococcus sp.]|nr:hypothetical protein [Ruminococcus sp.]
MKMKRIAAAVSSISLSAMMMLCAMPMSASAANTYTPIPGGEVTFEKYLVLKKEATVPNAEFSFSAAPIEDSEVLEATGQTLAVMKGPAGIKFKAGTDVTVSGTGDSEAAAAFKSADSTKAETEKGTKSINFATADTSDEKFAEKEITLDLSDVSFPEPGVYRYKITEADSDRAGITNDADQVRYLDVFVKSVSKTVGSVTQDSLEIDGYFIHTGNAAPKAGTPDNSKKSTGFSNSFESNNLEFSKEVRGNQGSKDKYFKFTVQLTNADSLNVNDNDKFTLTGEWDKEPAKNSATVYTAADMKAANNTESVTYAQLKAGYDFYLQSGQNIQIQGIPQGLGYVITEQQEDYDPSVTMDSTGDTKTGDKTGEGTAIAGVKDGESFSVTDTLLKSDAGADFVNERAGTIPTGVITTVAGSAGIVLLGAAGIAGAVYAKKKKDEDED